MAQLIDGCLVKTETLPHLVTLINYNYIMFLDVFGHRILDLKYEISTSTSDIVVNTKYEHLYLILYLM